MWQKTYRVSLADARVVAGEVIRVWKERFPTFWPPGNRFYARTDALSEGDVAGDLIGRAGRRGIRPA